jgi:hypothetical protein
MEVRMVAEIGAPLAGDGQAMNKAAKTILLISILCLLLEALHLKRTIRQYRLMEAFTR